MDNLQKFSGLAQDYTVGRPAYADAFIERLYSRYGFSAQAVIADIGAGTGKFAEQLLRRGSVVYCVEPNADMRNTAVEELGGYTGFHAVDGTAEETKLEEKSVDFITAAQAFHWFDPASFQRESRRILRRQGTAFLIWNVRDLSGGINQEVSQICAKFCPNFGGFSGGLQKDDIRIRRYFENTYEYVEFDNPLSYSKEKFISRSLSSSYALRKGDRNYGEFLDALNGLFEKYAENQRVIVANKTVAYIGSLD